jgi:hypothetical protein
VSAKGVIYNLLFFFRGQKVFFLSIESEYVMPSATADFAYVEKGQQVLQMGKTITITKINICIHLY